MTGRGLGSFGVLCFVFALGLAHAEPTFTRVFDPGRDVALNIYERLTQVYRVSGDDQNAADFVIQLVKDSQPQWRHRLRYQQDEAGNLLIWVPATGKFRSAKDQSPIALQSHLDMVAAAANDSDAAAYLQRHPIQLAQTGDEVHTQGFQTNQGADNGLGMALALRYLVDSSVDHPPLELMFTAREEIGLLGAEAWNMELLSPTIINLDWDVAGQVCVGCQGGQMVRANGRVQTQEIPEGYQLVKLHVSRLIGGHSGVDIHKARVHAVCLAQELLFRIASQYRQMMLVSLEAGDREVLNAIPRNLDLAVAVPADQAAALATALENMVRGELRQKQEGKIRDLTRLPIVTTHTMELPKTTKGIPGEVALHLAQQVLSIPQKVLPTPKGQRLRRFTTASLGHWSILPETRSRKLTFRLGALLRSFTTAEIDLYRDRFQTLLGETPEIESLQFESSQVFPPQLAQKTPFQQFLRSHFDTKLVNAAGSQETAVLALKYPDRDIISIGPTIYDAHSPRERFLRGSMVQTAQMLDELLSVIPNYHLCQSRLAGAEDTTK